MQYRKSLHILSVCCLLLFSNVAFAWSVPDTGDPNDPTCNPPSYNNLGNGIIKDNANSLMWQEATAPGTYTWDQAISYCAGLDLGGYSDWRLPTIQELSTLVDTSISPPGPTIRVHFHSTVGHGYWSSTSDVNDAGNAWGVNFYNGDVYDYGKTYGNNVRAVRGGSLNNIFVDNNDGTITDNSTGLMWEKLTGAITYTWDQAKAYCDNLSLGGKSDWRLPTRNELQTLVDYGRYNPAINTTFFPDALASDYWSSTTYAYGADKAWHVYFGSGYVYGIEKFFKFYVRAVRAGQCSASSSSTTTTTSGGTTTTTTSGGTTTTTSGSTTTTASANLYGTLWFSTEANEYMGFTNEGRCYISFDGGENWHRERIFKGYGEKFIILEIEILQGLVFIKGTYSVPDNTMTLNFFVWLWINIFPYFTQMTFDLVQTGWTGPETLDAQASGQYLLIETNFMQP